MNISNSTHQRDAMRSIPLRMPQNEKVRSRFKLGVTISATALYGALPKSFTRLASLRAHNHTGSFRHFHSSVASGLPDLGQ